MKKVISMNIAIITSGYLPVPPSKGGAVENLVFNLMKVNEDQTDNSFTIYSIEDDVNENFLQSNIKYIQTSVLSKFLDFILYAIAKYALRKSHLISYRYFFQRMEFMRKVGIDLAGSNYDVIILENNIVMFRALEQKNNFEKYKGKIIYHAHNELGKTLGYERYLNKLKRVICVSDYISDKYQSFLPKNVELKTVHNVVDENLFSKDALPEDIQKIKKRLKIDNEFPIILFTGRISKEKGILELLKALTKIDTVEYNLVIVGKSFYGANVSDEFEMRLQEESSKIRGNVVFTGYVDYSEMYKYYQMADFCVLPSIWNEPCALTVIECISSGVPLITTNTGGTPENVVPSTEVLEIENLEDSLAQVIDEYLNDKGLLESKKNQAKRERNHFGTICDYYNRFIEVLR